MLSLDLPLDSPPYVAEHELGHVPSRRPQAIDNYSQIFFFKFITIIYNTYQGFLVETNVVVT